MGTFGIEQPLSDPVCDRFASTLQLKNGRYEVSLPWREDLPDNYNLSWRRLNGLLQQNQKVLQEYHSIIQDQLEQGIVEEVKDSEVAPRTTHYHAVIRQDKETTKVPGQVAPP